MAILLTFLELLPYVALVLAVIGILIFYVLWEKKRTHPAIDDRYLIDIIIALGDIANIKHETIEHRRVQIDIGAPDKIDQEKLKSLGISAFLTGKKITLLMNEHGDRLLKHIKDNRKEER